MLTGCSVFGSILNAHATLSFIAWHLKCIHWQMWFLCTWIEWNERNIHIRWYIAARNTRGWKSIFQIYICTIWYECMWVLFMVVSNRIGVYHDMQCTHKIYMSPHSLNKHEHDTRRQYSKARSGNFVFYSAFRANPRATFTVWRKRTPLSPGSWWGVMWHRSFITATRVRFPVKMLQMKRSKM